MMKCGTMAIAALAALAATTGNATAAEKRISTLDLSKAFATRSPWHFNAVQGPDTTDTPSAEGQEPGPIRLCISMDGGQSCRPDLNGVLAAPSEAVGGTFSQAHYLGEPVIVHPAGDATLLRIDVGSLHAVDGDQLHGVVLLSYDRAADTFRVAYRHVAGHNNNQEIRYIDGGALRGAVISAEPTQDAPFGYWVTVSRFGGNTYSQALRYRSATRYGDSNPLAVIDAEMPDIQRRLGLWHSGQPLPLPEKGCSRPHLLRGALWC